MSLLPSSPNVVVFSNGLCESTGNVPHACATDVIGVEVSLPMKIVFGENSFQEYE